MQAPLHYSLSGAMHSAGMIISELGPADAALKVDCIEMGIVKSYWVNAEKPADEVTQVSARQEHSDSPQSPSSNDDLVDRSGNGSKAGGADPPGCCPLTL